MIRATEDRFGDELQARRSRETPYGGISLDVYRRDRELVFSNPIATADDESLGRELLEVLGNGCCPCDWGRKVLPGESPELVAGFESENGRIAGKCELWSKQYQRPGEAQSKI